MKRVLIILLLFNYSFSMGQLKFCDSTYSTKFIENFFQVYYNYKNTKLYYEPDRNIHELGRRSIDEIIFVKFKENGDTTLLYLRILNRKNPVLGSFPLKYNDFDTIYVYDLTKNKKNKLLIKCATPIIRNENLFCIKLIKSKFIGIGFDKMPKGYILKFKNESIKFCD